jgi:starch phosphorylase
MAMSKQNVAESSATATNGELTKLLKQYGCGPVQFTGDANGLYERHLVFDHVVKVSAANVRDSYEAVARSVRDVLSQRWVQTEDTYERENPKRVYYLSMEFLIGRSLANNISNLLLDSLATETVKKKNFDWVGLLEQEPDAGLGNGGLGRLAACFIDSMATMQLPAMGYGLRYEYGIFRQTIQEGWQHEQPDNWLRFSDPWEVARPHETVEVKLNCSFELRGGGLRAILGRPSNLIGIPYDRPVVGYGGRTINTLRLWDAVTPDYFDFEEFSRGDFAGALAETLAADSLTRVLYPDDSTSMGQGLRFVQEYFLVACSLADLVRRFRRNNIDWKALPLKAAIQMNDTHPAMAVPELMRILLDDAKLGWDDAWDLTKRTLAYTNHTLLPEALEKWPLAWFEALLPRQLEIIYEINRRFLDDVGAKFPSEDGRIANVSLIEEGPQRKIRMANLAIVGSHSTNGVAAIHSDLLRKTTVKDLAEIFPERFSNKTNGVTPRRWLLLANPPLASAITDAIGKDWITDLSQLKQLTPLAGDRSFQLEFQQAKREAKKKFADWLKSTLNVAADPDSIFDSQVKRIHEYKRQLLNALRIVVLYNRLRENPNMDVLPRTFFFAGKAAPAYRLAKLIIKFINNLAGTIDGDPSVRGRLKVVFVPDYSVSVAERLIPASEVSNQISTAGYEASGTSNMKFMMNGALTVGTRDGATIEMAEEAGEENFFLFGLTAEQVASGRHTYNPYWHYGNEPDTRAALDLIASDHFSRNEPGTFDPLMDTLLKNGDYYMHLADLQAYLESDRQLTELYADKDAWTRKAILNVASSGKFSSDRTIAEYAADIWNVEPCPVS